MSMDASEVGDDDGDDTPTEFGGEARVIRLEIVQEPEAAEGQAGELLEDLRRRAALKRNGDARTLSEALHEAAGGAERVQMQVIRERLNGLEARAADSQGMLRKQARVLRRVQMLVYTTLGFAAVGATAAVVVLLR